MRSKVPSLFTPQLLQHISNHPQLPKNAWYFIAAAALTVLNRPEEIPIVYKYALEHVTASNGSSKISEELDILRRIRESLLKTSAVAGAPKVINACIALKTATPEHVVEVDKGKSITGRKDEIQEVSPRNMLHRGQVFFDSVYGKISGKVTGMMKSVGTEDLDLVAKVMYGYILSNTTVLNQVETSYVLIAALIPQDCNAQLKGHLRGALNGGATKEEVRAVRDVVIKICEGAGMQQLDGHVGWGWQSEVETL